MNYLDRQMKGLIENIKTQIKREEAILEFMASLDVMHPQIWTSR